MVPARPAVVEAGSRAVGGAQADQAPSARVDPKRERIMTAAGDVLRAKGYAAMTTLDVARAAGISKRDLYARFASKDALVSAMVADGVREMLAPVPLEPPATREDFYAGLAAFGAKFTHDMLGRDRLAFYRLAIAEAELHPEIARALLDQGTRATTDAITAYFAAAEARGLVAFANRDAAVGVLFFLLIGDRMVTHLLDPARTVSDADNARHVALSLMVLRTMDQVR